MGVLNPSDFGALQLRRRTVVVALVSFERFEWPAPLFPPIVGDALREMMSDRGSRGANNWKSIANEIAPTLVSGNRNHGGAHLGPTRVGKAWASPGVNDPVRIDAAPPAKFVDMPKLTIPMCAVIQGFPRDWVFSGGKAATYRQVGTAFPPPVAAAVGRCIHAAFRDSPSN